MANPNSFEEYMPSVAPTVLQGPNGQNWLSQHGVVIDNTATNAKESTKVHFPESAITIGATDALPVIGTERQLPKKITETNSDYANRLRDAWNIWGKAGTPLGFLLALEILGYTAASGNPLIITQNGLGFTLNPDTTLSAYDRLQILSDYFPVTYIYSYAQTGPGTGNVVMKNKSILVWPHQVIVTIVSTGSRGIATFTYTIDGNPSGLGVITTPPGGVYTDANLSPNGVEMFFNAFPFHIGDTYTFYQPGTGILTVAATTTGNIDVHQIDVSVVNPGVVGVATFYYTIDGGDLLGPFVTDAIYTDATLAEIQITLNFSGTFVGLVGSQPENFIFSTPGGLGSSPIIHGNEPLALGVTNWWSFSHGDLDQNGDQWNNRWALFFQNPLPTSWTDIQNPPTDTSHPSLTEVNLIRSTLLQWKDAHSFPQYIQVPTSGLFWGKPFLKWGESGNVWGGSAIQWSIDI